MPGGPVRIASATWVGVDSRSGGATSPRWEERTKPFTMPGLPVARAPPTPVVEWHAAQFAWYRSRPALRLARASPTVGMGGPGAPNDSTKSTMAAISSRV